MKKLSVVVVVLVASLSFAQEIGTEINPVTPTSGGNTGNNNANNGNANPDPNSGNSGNSGNANTNTSGNSTYKPKPREGEKTFEGNAVGAQGGSFGLRGGFGSSGATGIPVGNANIGAPFVGVAFFATDAFKLLIDVGFGLGLSNNFTYAIGAAFGFDYMLRTPADALRPFITFSGLFTMAGASGDPVLGFGAQVGFGAEYFFSPNFSLNGRLMLVVPMSATGSGFTLAIVTVTPGVGATWYF